MSDKIELKVSPGEISVEAINENIAINVKPGEVITLTITIRSVPEEIEPHDPTEPPSLNTISKRVCATNGIKFEELSGKSRADSLPYLRHIFCQIAYNIYGYSKTDIGKHIKKDHTTVIHSLETFKALKETNNPKMAQYILITQQAFNVKL